MTRSESWNAFIDELRIYVQKHHHGFDIVRLLRQAQEPSFDYSVTEPVEVQEPSKWE